MTRVPCRGCGKEMAPAVISEEECTRLLNLYVGMVENNLINDTIKRLADRCIAENIVLPECLRRYGDPADWPEAS